MTDYFSLLGLSPHFDLDLPVLEKAYLAQQRLYHPDRYIGRPALERQVALQRSADINHAYDLLKSPLKRAQYLLKLQGVSIGTDQDSIKPSQALLAETLEWREQLEEARLPDETNTFAKAIALAVERSVNIISVSYGEAMWEGMAQETLRLGYLLKTQEEVTKRLRSVK